MIEVFSLCFVGTKVCYDETEHLTQKIREVLKKPTTNNEQDAHEPPIPTDKENSSAKEPDDDETDKKRDKASSLP